MRILRVITRLNIGGPSIQAITLTTNFERRGHVTRLLHGRLDRGEGDMTYLAPPGASLSYIPTLCRPIAPLDDLKTFFALWNAMREFQPDIVHTHMAKAGLLGRLAARAYNIGRGRRRARVVHTYHGHVLDGYFSPLKTSLFINLERLLARWSDRLIAISPAIRRDLLTDYRIGRDEQYAIVPLGFDLSSFTAVDDSARQQARLALNIPDGAAVISTIGRLTAIKQHGLFLDAVRKAAERRPQVIALIVGDGDLRQEIEATIQRDGLADRVRMLGWRKDLAQIYAATDVFLLTSRNEGTPVALIEAMAAATASVSTNVGGVKDVINSHDVGLLAPFGDADALAAHLCALIDDPQERRQMGAAARARVASHYSLDRLTNDIALVYAQLVGDN